MDEPHWLVVAIISGFIGFLIPQFWLYITFLIAKQKRHPLEGDWYGYYLIFQDKECHLGREKLTISKGIHLSRVKLLLRGNSLDNPAQTYEGEAWEEAGWLIIRMKPKNHDETILIRFKNPYEIADPIKHGLWSAIDFETKPAVGPMILSRTALTDARKQLEERLNHYRMDTHCKILQVN